MTADLWEKVKDNFDELLSRILSLETTFVQFETGICAPYLGSSAPVGFVLCSGRTIGNGSSGGTERANADTQSLFELLWNSSTNTELPIQDSSGSPTTRGASASADFASNKRMPLPDLRGRVFVGKDDMGGIAANRITNAVSGFVGTTLFATGGSQSHTLVTSEMPAHDHGAATGASTQTYTRIPATGGGASQGILEDNVGASQTLNSTGSVNSHTHSITSQGGGGAHRNVQPSIVGNWICKL